jgi:hypothetical protein
MGWPFPSTKMFCQPGSFSALRRGE